MPRATPSFSPLSFFSMAENVPGGGGCVSLHLAVGLCEKQSSEMSLCININLERELGVSFIMMACLSYMPWNPSLCIHACPVWNTVPEAQQPVISVKVSTFNVIVELWPSNVCTHPPSNLTIITLVIIYHEKSPWWRLEKRLHGYECLLGKFRKTGLWTYTVQIWPQPKAPWSPTSQEKATCTLMIPGHVCCCVFSVSLFHLS